MGLLEDFISNINTKNLFTKKEKLLIATSGGIDSVVLCKLCSLAGFQIGLAHCNFQLREAANDDETFVRSLAKDLGVPFFSVRFDTKNYATENRMSTQVAARNLRYQWFEDLRKQLGYNYILTAHHADDNLETLLMNFFRGTGIKGLTGIRERNGNVIRPLLFARRIELEEFLKQHQMQFVQDESNLQNDYTRNYLRNKILPDLEQVYPEVRENLLANIERLKGVEVYFNESVELQKKKLVNIVSGDIYIPVRLLQKTNATDTILFEILKEYGFSPAQAGELRALLSSESGRYVKSSTHRALKNRNHLIISALADNEKSLVVIDGAGGYRFQNFEMQVEVFENKAFEIKDDTNVASLDLSDIQFPLILRPWRKGDYFYPLGMEKKKKLSRFFIDRKLSMIEKEKIWVVESNRKIIWVVGQRIDNRFKITATSGKKLRLSFFDHSLKS